MISAIQAVCLDFNGVIYHHESRKFLPGMNSLLFNLQAEGLHLGLASRIPPDIVSEKLGHLRPLFGNHIYSGGGEGKLLCIFKFADGIGVKNLNQIAFVDDKPANLLPVAANSVVRVIGFKGSGKYPEAPEVCLNNGISYAGNINDLENMLFNLC
jgi:hypothetical protein